MTAQKDARYVWTDSEGLGRNLFACFRLAVNVRKPVKSALLHLFADTRYQLFVNGEFVEFGPTRFDPRFPLYDSVDLRPHLRRGRNVVALSVNSYQHKCIQAIPHPAGFIAWGEVAFESGAPVSLATPGAWRCTSDGAHQRYAPKYSFALNAAELFDQAGEAVGWKTVGYDDSGWPAATVLDHQDQWGPLGKRSIPFMAKTEVALERVKHLVPLEKVEDVYSFAMPTFPVYELNSGEYSNFVAFTTWVYSPVDQEVTVGVFWGENWLNGHPLERGVDCAIRNQRISQRWPLRRGWNHLFGKVGAYQDVVEQYFAVPLGAGILFSADRDSSLGLTTRRGLKRAPAARFKRTRLLTAEEYERHFAKKRLPFSPDDELHEVGGWVCVPATEPAQSPAREMGWDTYGEPVEKVGLDSLTGHVCRLSDYPHGFSLLLDAGQTRLVLPRLRLAGVAGATVDLTYYEHLAQDGMHLRVQHNHPCSDRILCSRGTLDWMPKHPRGFRYIMVTVRHPQGDVTIEGLTLRSAQYPVRETGRFACSDALLTEVWQMGQRTQATNMEDAYVDCVGRERGMYGRDTIIQYHVNLATFGDHALMGRCMELYGQSPDDTGKFRAVYPNVGDYTIADFALNMVEGYWNYYENSGDAARIRTDWPVIQRNLAWFHELADERKDLLLDAEWHKKRGIKAHYGGFHGDLSAKGYQSILGIHCGFSCTYLMAIQAAIRIARVLGEKADYRELERRANILTKSIRATFWDASRGCYADNDRHETHSAHASVLAVCCGAATPKQIPLLRAHVASDLRALFRNGYDPSGESLVSPNYAFYVFDGLYRLGLAETAENMMRQGWGWMRAQGIRTTAEYFTMHSSQCHAWSSSPTYYLSRNVLGVHFPKAPDMNEVEIRVQTHHVTWAEGAYPHPKGAIVVKWHTDGKGKRVFDYVKAPKGVRVTVVG